MNYAQTPAANTAIASLSGIERKRGSIVRLLAVAGAMEALYLAILRLNDLKEHVTGFILLVLLQGILYFVSVYLGEKISPSRSNLVLLFVAAVVFRATLFPLYPSLSDDLVRYRWEGKAQQAGYNPYLVRPADPQLAPLRDETYPAVVGPQYSTIYGPLMEAYLWLSYALFHKVVAMKLPFLLLDLGVILALFRLLPALGLSPMRAIIYAWSPLTVVEFAASGHNDPLPIMGLMLALLFYHKQQQRLSLGAIAASALSKVFAGFLVPVFLACTSWRLLWIPVLLAVLAFAPYSGAFRHLVGGLSEYGEHWRNNASLYQLIARLVPSNAAGSKIYLGIIGAEIVYCLLRRLVPERSMFLVLGTILLFSPNVFPWYLSWIVPLLCIYPSAAWMLLTILASLSYHVLIPYGTLGVWVETPVYAVLEYTPFFALLIGGAVVELVRYRRQSAAP